MRTSVVAVCPWIALSLMLAVPVPSHGRSPDASSDASSPGVSAKKPANGISVQVGDQFMIAYQEKIPGTDVTFEMIPVPGGKFMMGSPVDEEGRQDDEGPQVEVSVDPMWVAKTELTWGEYKEFMKLHNVFQDFSAKEHRKVEQHDAIDAVTAPTPLYEEGHTFEFGDEPDQPAVTMTLYSGKQYTKWLSLISGQQYRLPTEAEWEYAARAGTTTAYSWGDSEDDRDQYAWNYDNADSVHAPVGSKTANPFGLHDMHGSVGEWTVNQYTEDGYTAFVNQQPINATKMVVWPVTEWPCVIRGGTWQSLEPSELRSAARLASQADEKWKHKDPQIPKSVWWTTSDPTRGIGMRLFRSYKPLPPDQIAKFWNSNEKLVREVIDGKLRDGRAYQGMVDKNLPHEMEKAGY